MNEKKSMNRVTRFSSCRRNTLSGLEVLCFDLLVSNVCAAVPGIVW